MHFPALRVSYRYFVEEKIVVVVYRFRCYNKVYYRLSHDVVTSSLACLAGVSRPRRAPSLACSISTWKRKGKGCYVGYVVTLDVDRDLSAAYSVRVFFRR